MNMTRRIFPEFTGTVLIILLFLGGVSMVSAFNISNYDDSAAPFSISGDINLTFESLPCICPFSDPDDPSPCTGYCGFEDWQEETDACCPFCEYDEDSACPCYCEFDDPAKQYPLICACPFCEFDEDSACPCSCSDETGTSCSICPYDEGSSALIQAMSGAFIPEFNANITSGNAPLTVAFSDRSSGKPDEWFWDFGDGETSVDQNPVHTYTQPGAYTVTLTISQAYGGPQAMASESQSRGKDSYIQITGSSPVTTVQSMNIPQNSGFNAAVANALASNPSWEAKKAGSLTKASALSASKSTQTPLNSGTVWDTKSAALFGEPVTIANPVTRNEMIVPGPVQNVYSPAADPITHMNRNGLPLPVQNRNNLLG